MKRCLLLVFSMLSFFSSIAQTLEPIQLEIYDPFASQVFQPSSSAVDNTGNTFVSISDGMTYAGIVKLNAAGNILWQKKMPGVISQVTRATKVDGKNLLFKPSDGVYFGTEGGACSACSNMNRYLSKCNPNTGTFLWHIKYVANDDEGYSSIILDAPNGVYWIHGQRVFNISPTGTVLFEKKLYRTIRTATTTPDGTLYLGCLDYSLGSSIVKMNSAGNIINSTSISDLASPYMTPLKFEYNNGFVFMGFGGNSEPTKIVKMDTLGNVFAAKQWTMTAGYSVGANWIIYKNKIVFSHGSKIGPIENFVRLNSFSVFDLNINELETFCYPHFATFDLSSIYGMGPYPGSPEVFTVNGDFLQVIGNKGESSFQSGSFLRVDSTLMFKGCTKVVDTLDGYAGFTALQAADTANCVASANPVLSIFPSNTNFPFLSKRNDLTIDSIPATSIYCGECSSVALGYTSGDAAVVYYNWGTETGGQTNNPATNLCPGNYHLTVSDNYGCKDSSAFQILTTPLPSMNYCLITVDSSSTFNVLLWEKPVSTTIAGFNIYREITTSNFQLIAFVPYDSLSQFNDSLANPNITNYRYKITTLDTCGFESDQSDFHSTIHLQLLGSGNMQWTLYDIENQSNPVSFYNIYRDNLSDGTWTLLTGTLPGTNSTFTDLNHSLYPNASYRADVNWGLSCTPTRATVNTSRSNIKRNSLIISGITSAELAAATSVYPNPAINDLTLELSGMIKEATVKIYTTLGQTVYEEILIASGSSKTVKHIDITDFARGIYTVSIESKGTKVYKKLVVN